MNYKKIVATIFFALLLPFSTKAATLSVTPSTGNFSVGSTFDVSVMLDTNGKSVNALSVGVLFPPDMLQIVSPSTGQSIIGVWTATPKFDNQAGRVELQGGIPGGITASGGLVTTLTFRVKSVGQAVLKFTDKSKVLLNDGLGTNALTQTGNAIFEFRLPPPAGPTLNSETNPDQATWYANRSVSFRFAADASTIQGYSYILSDDPATIPDDISEGTKNSVSYANLSDGTHYFHIKSLRDGAWGGTTHYAAKIDATPPASFKIDVAPDSHTASHQPIIQFSSSDALSGIDHYEIKIISLSEARPGEDNSFFIETTSPYVPPIPLALGNYDIVVRAYDKAHNVQEVTKRLQIVRPLFSFITPDGLRIGSEHLAWGWFFAIMAALLGGLGFMFVRAKKFHKTSHEDHSQKALPKDVLEQLNELKKYRAKYGGKALALFLVFSLFTALHGVHAEATIAPPLITTVSNNVSNQEIFYAGGKTDFANEQVILYMQNLATGETFSQTVTSDNKGDWFYRHNAFLSPGNYLLWAQAKLGSDQSPPGPQVLMKVSRTAVQFGGSKISYELIYLILVLILLAGVLGLGTFTAVYIHRGRKKQVLLKKEIKDAEESVKRGFAVLRRDIEAELEIIKKAKLSTDLSKEEKERETELLADLEMVQSQLGKEIWEIEHSA